MSFCPPRRRLRSLTKMTITRTPVTDEGVAHITRRLHGLVEFGVGRNANITRVDLRSMANLRRTPEEFLADCPALRLLNMSGLLCLGTIRHQLSRGCIKLQAVNLSHMTALRRIGGDAFYECKSLISANFSNLSHVEELGRSFMSRCTALPAIDMRHMTALRKIGDEVFSQCTSLNSANLSNRHQ